ncbi:MAG: serine/threonine-protein kinase [Planctomycetota bacterium]
MSGLPRRLGPFELRELLGRGGMGAVYRAHDPAAGRDVALKVLELDPLRRDDAAAERFAREARAAGALRHPNLVAVHAHGVTSGAPWLAMELVEGRSLDRVLEERGPLPAAEAARLAQQVALAVAHAHEHGVVHRDLKPANVILGPDGAPRLTDFGLAKELRESAESLTRSGAVLGTPGYLSPEQADGRAVSAATDVYGLGARARPSAAGA